MPGTKAGILTMPSGWLPNGAFIIQTGKREEIFLIEVSIGLWEHCAGCHVGGLLKRFKDYYVWHYH